jgi:uncharacterized protein
MDMSDKQLLDAKYQRLVERLSKLDSLAVALSGGVDSSLLLAVAHQAMGKRVVAFTAKSATHPEHETDNAREIAMKIGVKHVVFESHELENPEFTANDPMRCYHCKRQLFTEMRVAALELGIKHLAHGANADDHADYRPGFKAALELDIIAPLVEAEFTKPEIRELARDLGLSNWNRPAMACLATRLPYGTRIDMKRLKQIQACETILNDLGIRQCRVRHHGPLARIEMDREEMLSFDMMAHSTEIVDGFKALGFDCVCLDLEGYVSGKMNRSLE